jgi:hypothetical protein
MRKVFVVLVLAVGAAIPAGCMSGDSEQSARRTAAAGVQEPVGYAFARLSLEGLDMTWRSFSWGVSADVVESRAADAEGATVYRLNAGQTKPGTLTLERGVATDSSQLAQLFASGELAYASVTLTLYATDGSSALGTYTLSSVVLADLKHRSSENVILETLTIRFAGSSFEM